MDIGAEASNAVSERLNDSDNPATLDDIDGTIETVFRRHVTDSQGNLLDFGTPETKLIMAHAMQEARASLIPQAEAAIKAQTDTRFLNTWATNSVREAYRGAPIGAPVTRDPLAPLPEPGVPTDSPSAPSEGAQVEGVPAKLAHFDFEAALRDVPPGISKATARSWLLTALFDEARARGDVGPLMGLESSRKADGFPVVHA